MDSIGDFINRLKNAGAVGKHSVSAPFSLFTLAVAEKLKDAGYVVGVEKKGKKVHKTIDVTLKYTSPGVHAILGASRISRPGRRIYKTVNEIVPVRYGHGSLFLSTSKGVMTDTEARKAKLGGEALFEIW